MPASQAVLDLIERFERNREAYLSGREKTAMQRQTALQRQIGATDKQIDNLVYELYELGEEELGIVEG